MVVAVRYFDHEEPRRCSSTVRLPVVPMLPVMVNDWPETGLAGVAVGAGAVSTAVADEAKPSVAAMTAMVSRKTVERRTQNSYENVWMTPGRRISSRIPFCPVIAGRIDNRAARSQLDSWPSIQVYRSLYHLVTNATSSS